MCRIWNRESSTTRRETWIVDKTFSVLQKKDTCFQVGSSLSVLSVFLMFFIDITIRFTPIHFVITLSGFFFIFNMTQSSLLEVPYKHHLEFLHHFKIGFSVYYLCVPWLWWLPTFVFVDSHWRFANQTYYGSSTLLLNALLFDLLIPSRYNNWTLIRKNWPQSVLLIRNVFYSTHQ